MVGLGSCLVWVETVHIWRRAVLLIPRGGQHAACLVKLRVVRGEIVVALGIVVTQLRIRYSMLLAGCVNDQVT